MSKKILYYLGGVVVTLFLLLFSQTNYVLAQEGECHLKHCLVPAPTILMPADGDVVYTSRPEIRGLSWKTTIVKVYVDDIELENVQFKKHEDYYGSFFVVPNFDLSPGEHYIYTIAHSEKPGWFDQSKESLYIDLTVKKIVVQAPVVNQNVEPVLLPVPTLPEPITETPILPELPQEKLADLFPQTEPEDLPDLLEEVLKNSENNDESMIEIVNSENPDNEFEVIDRPLEGEIDITEGQIEGGVSIDKDLDSLQPNIQEAAGLSDLGELLKDEFEAQNNQDKERQNRLIGLVMLAIILVVTIIWLSFERQNKIKRGIVNNDDDGELPPPPQPPTNRKARKLAKKNKLLNQEFNPDDEITIEPIKEEIDLLQEADQNSEREYWASPPPSPYSPYPTSVESDDSEEKQNDIGV